MTPESFKNNYLVLGGSRNILSGLVIGCEDDGGISFLIKTAFDSVISVGSVPSKCIFLIRIYPHLKSVIGTFASFKKRFRNQPIIYR